MDLRDDRIPFQFYPSSVNALLDRDHILVNTHDMANCTFLWRGAVPAAGPNVLPSRVPNQQLQDRHGAHAPELTHPGALGRAISHANENGTPLANNNLDRAIQHDVDPALWNLPTEVTTNSGNFEVKLPQPVVTLIWQ